MPTARSDLPFGHELRLFMVWPIWSVLIPFRIAFCWSIDDDCAGGFYVRASIVVRRNCAPSTDIAHRGEEPLMRNVSR